VKLLLLLLLLLLLPVQVIDTAELQRRMDASRESGEQHFYIMEMGPGLFIDARRKGNHARLLNSCCEPNCETQKW
jgi:SET domain-containing protein